MLDIKIILNKINRSIVDKADIDRSVSVLRSCFLSKPDGGQLLRSFRN